ncbi:hypothetical protein TRFO_36847 [Tritrichomonas foetus]|uniref:Uncharacterized protein n=1 Tax=Tritrichomonas foetus TaxID=1144522 RepID=A0A1J4JD04_9EUKA|nr:hypothetical protein TRFO_36847 [Tritrichomonas foetus]|eukprot:OHS96992.1 hypothetical protein TRFO_36847 [Tritrichomonas foetus]
MMASSTSWDDVINESPNMNADTIDSSLIDNLVPSIHINSALFDDDDDFDDASNRTSSSSLFTPILHRRSNSCHIQHPVSHLPPLYKYQSMSTTARDLLPRYISEMLEEEEEPNFTIAGYDEHLERKEKDLAQKVLDHLISKTKDPKEQSKIYRAAANANKRHFFNVEACQMHELAENSDPETPQNYIDHAKLLDEIGLVEDAEKVLLNGLEKTGMCESIITKLIKQFERRRKFDSVRQTLGMIYSKDGIQKITAPSFAEGALFESRHGNVNSAILAFNTISSFIPIKTGYYVEFAENIKRRGFERQALQITQTGVEKFPAMPNNWCQLIQLQTSPENVMVTLQKAAQKISPLMMSKLEQSAAVMCGYFSSIKNSRSILSECIVKVPSDQRWRILYNAAMIELLYGDSIIVILILNTAAHFTPEKFAPTVILAMAKVYEINNDISSAMNSYNTLIKNHSGDWRVYLEKSMFLIRFNRRKEALECTKAGLSIHPNTGRLWALRIQLEDVELQIPVLKEAIMSSPKSGEVWTEAARIVLNPLSPYFNLKSAKFFLNTAYLFTPQYIDLFIEMIRLEILENGINANLDKVREIFLSGDGNYGTVIFQFRKLGKEFTCEEFECFAAGVREDVSKNYKIYQRAITRTVFVNASTRKEEEKLKIDQTKYSPHAFAFGLTSFLGAMTNHPGNDAYKAVILGSSSVLM